MELQIFSANLLSTYIQSSERVSAGVLSIYLGDNSTNNIYHAKDKNGERAAYAHSKSAAE